MPQLDINDIQGNVVAGYGTTHARYVFVAFDDVDEGSRLIRSITPTAASERVSRKERDVTTCNVAFSASGMVKLGLPPEAIQTLPLAFRAGMKARCGHIGDTGDSSPKKWEDWCDVPIDAVVTITGWMPDRCDEAVARLALRRTPLHVQSAAALDEDWMPFSWPLPELDQPESWHYEHFGFRDGLSNPTIEGSERPLKAGDGTLRDGRWRPMKAGEFILGYEDDTRSIDLPRTMRTFFRNGSYMVWRKLEQDVIGFHDRYGLDLKLVEAARLVGRWPDGTPLAVSPDGHPKAPNTNDFTFGSDPLGRLCPVSAHIRRANPRDALDFADDVVGRHRIIRRGMPYHDVDDDKQGLIFVCFNADIERQFEFIQRRWIIDDPARATTSGPDPIAASATGEGLAPYVRTRGGEYFFQPGLFGLEELRRASERMSS